MYVAGGLAFGPRVATLLHTTGNGTWVETDAPDHANAFAIWGRSADEIHVSVKDSADPAGGGPGVLRWQKKASSTGEFLRTTIVANAHLAGNADEVFVAYEELPASMK